MAIQINENAGPTIPITASIELLAQLLKCGAGVVLRREKLIAVPNKANRMVCEGVIDGDDVGIRIGDQALLQGEIQCDCS